MIEVDIHEPSDIITLLRQTCPVVTVPLNEFLLPDYMWYGLDNRLHGVNRKQAGELVSDIDNCERQLSNELGRVDDLSLVVEGIISPSQFINRRGGKSSKLDFGAVTRPGQMTYTYSFLPGGKLANEREHNTSYSYIMAWLWSLDKSGVTHFIVSNSFATAYAIASWRKNSLESKHTTLRRYIKPKVDPGVRDRFVLTLMGVEGGRIGEATARVLLNEFGTPWNILAAEREELYKVKGIGEKWVDNFFVAIGRDA